MIVVAGTAPSSSADVRRVRLLVAVVAAVTALLSGCSVSRTAGEPDAALTARLAEVPVVSLRAPEDNPTLDPDVLADFWDSARVRSATPQDAAPAAGPGVPVQLGELAAVPGTSPGVAPGASVLLVRSPTGPFRDPVVPPEDPSTVLGEVVAAPVLAPSGRAATLAARVTGRLFFTVAGQPRSCTATAVASGSGSLVATAGHCLLTAGADGSRAEAANLLFGPGYVDGTFPFGRWRVESVHIAQGWVQGPVWAQDVAFLRVARSQESGESLQNAVGALGVVFDATALGGQPTALLGYPSVAPFDGATLRWCATSSPAPAAPVDPGGFGVRCAMTAGYSGGPAVTLFDPASGGGYVAGIASHDYSTGIVYVARLGPEALAAYSEADQR